jgi:putative N6-adenine-specific DNA methylase
MSLSLFLPCPRGMEPLLADELALISSAQSVALHNITAVSGGVSVQGDSVAAMALNLHSRLASRVLITVARGAYHDEQSLYEVAASVPWADWFDYRHTLRVDVTAQHSPLRSLQFATLKIKDAICDVQRDATGERPSIDTVRPGVRVFAHLTEDTASIYLDTSGEPLFKRGWRLDKGEAPLKETLAAAVIYASGWDCSGALPLYDPCGGSGTLVIEAAQMAANIAPGLERPFGFERLFGYDAAQWGGLRNRAKNAERVPSMPLFFSDIAFRMTDFAERNAERAGVAQFINFTTADVLQRPAPAPAGTLVMNPPYGERIEVKGKGRGGRQGYKNPDNQGFDEEEASVETSHQASAAEAAFFSQLASHWKAHFSGWSAWVLSPDMKLPHALRLKESRRVPLWNGAIECRLFKFDMVKGSAR